MNKYSIILPVRNGGEYVKACVKSILSQTYPYFNLIVLDNNSNDGTKEWIESLNNDKITVYSSERDLTIEENWSRAVDVPKNEFMTLIGHDDLLHSDYLQKINTLIRKHPEASLYQTHYQYINYQGNFVRHCLPMEEVQYAHEFLSRHIFHSMDSMGTGYMFRSEDYHLVGGIPSYPNLIFADYALWIKLSNISYKATDFSNSFSYRLHDSLSKTTDGYIYQDAFFFYIDFLIDFKKNNSMFEETLNRYGTTLIEHYCEALSHRILKSTKKNEKITIETFVEKCVKKHTQITNYTTFKPYENIRIKYAKWIENYFLLNLGFKIYQYIK